MKRLIGLASCAIACALVASPVSAAKDGLSPQACAAKSSGVYGFQCHGSLNTGGGMEPVTFVGTVEGDDSAVYEGYGTFNWGQGSFSTHVVGSATFGKNCFGRVVYSTNEILIPGGAIPLPPLTIDFIPVDDFHEILGTSVASTTTYAGPITYFDPRLTCRLVRIRR